jgi:T1SS-143 domain-containing protein
MANSSSAQQLNIEAGQNIAVKMIAGQNLVLTSEMEVQGMKLTSGGELVLTLSDGAMLTITNFAEIAKAGNTSLQLPNGQSVGMAQLAEALNPQGAIGATNLEYGAPDGKLAAGNGDSHLVKKPGKDEDIVVKLQPGDEYKFSFSLTEPASVKESGGQLVISFKNGGEIIIPNYGAFKDAGTLPDFTLADGTTLGVGEFGEVLASAAQVSAIEPAAGGDGGGGGAGGGFGFGSTFSAGPLDGIGAIGPIDPTQLEYRADFRELDPAQDPDFNPNLTTPPAAVVDETNLSPGPVTVDGTVTANFGGDGPGTFGATPTGTNFQYSGSTAPALTSEGQPVTVTLVGNTYTGEAHGDVIFTLTINPDGTYHFELTGTLDHLDPNNPDDAIDLQFGVTATDNDGDTDDGFITITVKDDGPVANDDFNSFNGEDHTTTGNVVTGVNGGPGAADDLSEDTGNYVSSVTVGGVTTTIPAGGTVMVTGSFGILTISSTGEYSYTLNPGVNGDTTENFTYTLTDGDGDSDPAILRIDSDGVPTIVDPNDPSLPPGARTVDETDMNGGSTSVSGTITANYYTDAPGSITPTGAATFSASTALTSEGNPVAVTLTGNTYTGTANGATVFTLTVNTDGTYTYTQLGTLDHPLGGANHDDVINLNFGVTATDSDGDSVTATLTINVRDDGPTANDDHNSFNAEDVTTTGNVVTGLNGGPGAADALSEDAGNTVTSVTVGGITTNIPDGGTVVVAGTYGLLAISSDGTYQYSLYPASTGDTVDNFTYTLTDGDGDTDTAVLSIDADGVPVIYDPNDPNVSPGDRLVDESNLGPTSVSGDLNANFFTDAPGTITFDGPGAFFTADGSTGGALTSEGTPVDVTLTGNTYTGTANGNTIFTLTLNPATGVYTFTLLGTLDHADPNNANDVINLNFGVTATDSDGDTDTSILTIRVVDDAPVANDDFNTFDIEDVSTTGNVVTGLNGGAGAADTLSEDDGNSVTSVTFGATTVAVPAGGSASIAGANGTLVINSDGSYTYTLNPGVKGDVGDDFTYGLTDGDGDTDTAVLHLDADGRPDIYNPNDPNLSPGTRTVDETNMGPTTSVSGDLNANFYSDTPGTITPTGAATFSFGGSAAGGALTSEGYPVTVTLVGNTYTGTANGATVFTLSINPANGNYTFTLVGTLDHADINNPDDVIQLNFGVTATDSDGDTDSATLTINVKDDGPVAHDDHNSYNTADGGTDGNVITGVNGGPGAADNLSQDDGNTVTKISFGTTTVDVPTTGTVSIHGDHGTLTIAADGSYTYVLDAGAGGGSGGTVVDTPRTFTGNTFPTLPSEGTNIGPGGAGALGELPSNMAISPGTTVSGQVTFEGAGYTNSLGVFTVAADGTLQAASMIAPQINGPGANFNAVGGAGAASLGFFLVADGFSNNGAYAGLDFSTGTLNFVYDNGLGTERPATVNDAGGHVSLVFTSAGGVETVIQGPIYFTSDRGGSNSLNPDGLVHTVSGVGSDPNTLTIAFEDLPNGGDFDYNDLVFNVQLTDHTTTGGGDVGDQFVYTLTDGDGDSSTAVLHLDGDGQPVIADPATRTIDESDLNGGTTSVSGHVTADFFTDGPGTITPTGANTFTSSTTLTSGGQPVTVTVNGGVYTGTAGGQTVFTLTIQPNGDYKFDLKGTLDHPNTGNPDDAINLTFGITATDNDGDKDTSTLTIVVKDDGPVANDDTNTFNGEAGSTNGNVVTGFNGGTGAADKLSQDDTNVVTKVSFGGTTVNVPTTGTATINGTNGVLVIKADGTYTYTLKPGVNGDTADQFTYTLKDGDGDTDTAILKITSDGVPEICDPNAGNDSRTVDESNMAPNTSVTGQLAANFFADTPGSFLPTGAGTFSSSTALTSEGRPVSVTLTGNTYTGTANGVTIFTLTVNADGSYKFDLKGTLDHPDAANPDDVIKLNFGVTARDSDGDTDTATLTINVKDDGPVANDDTNSFNGEAGTTNGNVVTGFNGGTGAADKLSQDDTNVVTKVSFGGTTVNVPTTGTATINGTNGTLVIKADGTYTYTLKPGTHGDTSDSFTYTLKDGDGDTDTAILKIKSDGTPEICDPNVGPDSRTVDETNLNPETSVTGTVVANFYTDTPGTFLATGANTFSFGGSTAATLTSEGRPVTVTLTGNTYTGTAGGQTIFTLQLNADGTYKFDLKGTLDHADKSNPDDVIQLNFGVTARDSDGDTDSATLTINVRDDGPVAHNDVNNLNITTQTVPVDKDYNVVLVLDVSGSMAGNKLALLKAAVNNLLTTFNNYQGGDVKVHFVTFASQSGAESTFTITNAAEFAAAKAFINGLVANGNTNYEDALQNAVTWLQSGGTGGPIAGGDTYTYFVSDGEPNTYVSGTNHSVSGSAGTVMNEIQGIGESLANDGDGTQNEVGALQALSTQVIAVGIGVSGTTLGRLDVIDSNGDALDVRDPADLSSALQGSNPVTTVTVEVATGNVITGLNGGAGAADDKSEDDVNTVSAVKFGATTVTVPTTGFTTINGDFGTLKIYADGSYTYTVFSGANLSNGIHDTFTYTLKDGDGDTSNATLQFNGTAPAVKTPELTTCDIWVKEDNSVALSVQAKLVTPGAGDQLTITISGIKDGWTVDTSASGGTYNATTHTWTLTLAPGVTSYNGGPIVKPPANSDADMAGLVVKATASNGVTTATATGTENVYVDAVADAITVNASNTTGHDNTAIPLTITVGASGDTDGSEKITKVVISGLPAGGTLNHGTQQPDGSWVLTKADLTGLTMNPGGYMGNVALTVKAYNVETTLSGLENDTSDNTYIATTNLNVNVFCDPNPPTLEVCDVWVKEDKSVALNVQASLNFPHPGEHLVITISGFKDGWTVNTTASGGTYDATTKTWSITLPPGVNFSGGPTVKPPANSDLDLTGLQVKAVATDGTYSATSTATENVFVDAVIDAPVLTVPATVNYLWVVNQTNPSALPITTKVTDTDGSETITKVVLDLNNTFTNPAGGFYTLEDIGVKLNKGTETAPGIWTINVNAGDAATALNGLALITPNSNYYWPLHNGSHSGTITVQSYAKETTLGGLENDTSDNQTVVTAYICYTFAVSPLVLDLGQNGFDLVGQDQGVLFDMTNDGLKDKTSWVGASDGLLAIDLNHDGVINNQSELFGNNGTASDGFANLAQYDSNADGKIDATDAVFADLKVWQDANQDGVSDAGELQSLTAHGINSISLSTTAINQMIGENGITDVANVTYADGSQGQIADVWFNVQDAADRTGVTFRGDASDDYVTGTYKNDFLGGGDGDNQLTGGEGGDTFFLDAGGMAVITDFNLNAGDSLDLSDILTAFDPLTDSLHNFVHAVSDGADTLIQVDPTGTGSAFTTIAVLEGVHVDLNALTAHGNLIA